MPNSRSNVRTYTISKDVPHLDEPGAVWLVKFWRIEPKALPDVDPLITIRRKPLTVDAFPDERFLAGIVDKRNWKVVVDPIEELSDLALRKGVGLHVDNCLGGFLLSYMQREGLFSGQWDFAAAGVTTMSVDLHKYGFGLPLGGSNRRSAGRSRLACFSRASVPLWEQRPRACRWWPFETRRCAPPPWCQAQTAVRASTSRRRCKARARERRWP